MRYGGSVSREPFEMLGGAVVGKIAHELRSWDALVSTQFQNETYYQV